MVIFIEYQAINQGFKIIHRASLKLKNKKKLQIICTIKSLFIFFLTKLGKNI